MSRVAVVGTGIVGAAVARELAVRGVDVIVLDRGEVSCGTTGLGEGNVLAGDKGAGPELDLTLAGLAVYDELDARLGPVARIRRKGSLIVHPEPDTWAAEPARIARMDVEARLVEPAEVAALEPELTGALAGATHFPGDIQVAPREIARALVAEARSAGAELRTLCPVEAVLVERDEGDGDRVHPRGAVRGVRTARGDLPADAVVIAAGPWSAALAQSAGVPLPLEPRKGQLLRLRAPRPDMIRHKVVDGSYLRSVASTAPGLQISTVVETTWDGDVLVGSSRERRGFDLSVDPSVGDAMLARAARLFPGLTGLSRVAEWAGLRPWLPDHRPAIGRVGDVAGLWLATGHEGAGVALGPVTGRLVAQLYCGETPLVDPAPFSPDRFAGARAASIRL